MRHKFSEHIQKITRQARAKLHLLACGRMKKTELAGMKALSRQAQFRFFPPVNSIAQNRMPYMRHMYAYLVCAPRFEPAAHMRVPVEPRGDLIMRHGGARVIPPPHRLGGGCGTDGENRLTLSVRWMAANRRIDSAAVVFQNKPDYSVIFPF